MYQTSVHTHIIFQGSSPQSSHPQDNDCSAKSLECFDSIWRNSSLGLPVWIAAGEGNGTSMGTPDREPQEYSRNGLGIYLPQSLYSYHILGFPVWGPHFIPFQGGGGWTLFIPACIRCITPNSTSCTRCMR